MFRVGNGDARAVCGVCLGLAVKAPGVFIVGFEHSWHPVLVFLLLNLGK